MSQSEMVTPVARLLAPLTEGRVPPGSDKGRTLLEEALRIDPDRAAELIGPIDPAALREGMRAALLPERRIAQLLRSRNLDGLNASDPFSRGLEAPDPTPFPDPALELERGPRPPWAR